MVGQPLQHIADIDRQAAGWRRHCHPAAIGAEDFQPGFFCTKQKRDKVDILVRAGADFLAVSAGIWSHPGGPRAAVSAFNAIFDRAAKG